MRQISSLFETRRAFAAILALGLFAMAARPVIDPDFWWHLRTGQLIVATLQVFHTDPYSFTRFGQTWINHEWLSDAFIFILYRLGSWGLLIATFAVTIAASFLLALKRSAAPIHIAGVFVIWAAIASMPLWGVRPQMLSLLLASIFLWLGDAAGRRPNRLWWMLPLMVLWVNLHAGFAIGLALIALFLAGDGLDLAFGFEPWRQMRARVWRLAAVLLGCVALVPLNPYGVRMYAYPFATLHSESMQRYIVEWFSPDFHQIEYLPFLLLLLATLLIVGLSAKKLRPRDSLLLLVTAYAALRSIRNIPLFAIVAAPILSGLVGQWLLLRHPPRQFVNGRPANSSDGTKTIRAFNGLLIAALVVLVAARLNSVVRRQPASEAEGFPAGAVAFIGPASSGSPDVQFLQLGRISDLEALSPIPGLY